MKAIRASLSIDVESALAAILEPIEGENVGLPFRSKLHVAISSLPPEERQVIELILKGLPDPLIQTKMSVTIAKVVGCSEKTVRNRRDRAFEKLRDALKEEETRDQTK